MNKHTEVDKSVHPTSVHQARAVEPTRERPRLVPRSDVFETESAFTLLADMPGVDEKSVEVTLHDRVLTITGSVNPRAPEGYRRVYAEFEDADYQRAFQLSGDVDAAAIRATVKNGVVRISVPKLKPAQKKVPVLAG
jgi:HSP20 family molecular chaperone IbpA